MRFRFKAKKRDGAATRPSQTKFAWMPVRLSNRTWVWLEKYRVGYRGVTGPQAENVLDLFPQDHAPITMFAERRSA